MVNSRQNGALFMGNTHRRMLRAVAAAFQSRTLKQRPQLCFVLGQRREGTSSQGSCSAGSPGISPGHREGRSSGGALWHLLGGSSHGQQPLLACPSPEQLHGQPVGLKDISDAFVCKAKINTRRRKKAKCISLAAEPALSLPLADSGERSLNSSSTGYSTTNPHISTAPGRNVCTNIPKQAPSTRQHQWHRSLQPYPEPTAPSPSQSPDRGTSISNAAEDKQYSWRADKAHGGQGGGS